MTRILIVGAGGFIGAILRYLVGGWVQEWSKSVQFPYGTLVVNLTGCLVIGFLAYLSESRGIITTEMRSFLMIGILGAYTTFSTFTNESSNLLRGGENMLALFNIGAHIFLGLAAVWLGRQLAYILWR